MSILLFIGFTIKNEPKKIKNPETTRNLIPLLNLTDYNMVRFVDYENLEFNAISVFKYFRKKFFNVSYVNYNYDEKNNVSKLEYIIGIFDEKKNLINPNNLSNTTKFDCFQKIKKNFDYQKPPLIIDDKYFKCIGNFNFSASLKFGLGINRKKVNFKIILDFSDVFKSRNLNFANNTYQNAQ